MNKKHIILIAEDNRISRKILVKMFSKENDVLEAENGQQTIEILENYKDDIIAIILDLRMPEKDGYEVLSYIKENGLNQIPVVVMTSDMTGESEERALDLGAWDFVSKPYEPRILMTRVNNAIARSRMSYLLQLKHVVEHDKLTDLYNRNHFLEMTEKMVSEHKEDSKALIRVDIRRFHLINSFFGEKGGDEFLKYVANQIKEIVECYEWSVYGRMESDVFCACIPYDEDICKSHIKKLTMKMKEYNPDYRIEPSYGIYRITDDTLSASEMLRNASLASMECKENYTRSIAFFDESMRERLHMEEEIIQEMQDALVNGEFEVYYQPKYETRSKTPNGAEALVRWNHPKRGIIHPSQFVPVLEKNGFIGDLDIYVWKIVCRQLKAWKEKGIQAGPISVNVARADIQNPNLVEYLTTLVEEYELAPENLCIELTESAYMDSPLAINEVVKKLHEAGFSVVMDEFGKGYSSLNVLKDVDVDFLKINMKSLSLDPTNVKSKRILSSVIAMMQWLDIPVITMEVETEEEYTFLKSVGCEYIQGFYFVGPLPAEEYEQLLTEQKD